MIERTPIVCAAPTSVWAVMRSEFKLDHQINRPEVQQQLHWLRAHPGYFAKLSEAKPYLYHIVNEIKKRNMPGEIALIPMIESAYDPFAYSVVGAAGLWQLMPHTGKDLGLKQDWWSDSRRSITPSTSAALNYLLYLHHFFQGDWNLAIAAYDAGEGTIARAIKNIHQPHPDFWSLSIPRETQLYLPRLLALAEIIGYPERYHLTLPSIPHTPYFEEIAIKSHIDLNRAAKLAGMSYQELIKLNPGFNRWTTAPYKPFKLLIPAQKVDQFYQNLALDAGQTHTSLSHYYVRNEETLNDIAQRFATTVNQLKQLNQLESNLIRTGQILLIPTTSATSTIVSRTVKPSMIKVIHIVQANETLAQIAHQYKITESSIKEWNHLANRPLIAQQQLVIWKTT